MTYQPITAELTAEPPPSLPSGPYILAILLSIFLGIDGVYHTVIPCQIEERGMLIELPTFINVALHFQKHPVASHPDPLSMISAS